MPKVSVLLPVYNAVDKYLRSAIDSIHKQTFPDFELLIINDACTDENIEKVVLSYKDARISYSVNTTHQSITKTRNTLVAMSKCAYEYRKYKPPIWEMT
jgi:glycosyltransferase involved in cell wall biosynthesis